MKSGRVRRAVAAVQVLVALLLAAALVVGDDRAASGGGATADRPLVIASGGTQGVYFQYATALAGELRTAGISSEVLATRGSVDNLTMLGDGRADCAFVAEDAAVEAVRGASPFARSLPVRAVARVYDDYLHLVTRADSAITGMRDLMSMRVSVGPEDSGTRLMVNRLLGVANLQLADLRPSSLGINESLEALAAGRIDAFFWSGGIPTSGLAELADRLPVRLVPLTQYVPQLRRLHDGVYRIAVVPPGTYGITESVGTLAVANDIVCSGSTPAGSVRRIVDALFRSRQTMAAAVPQALALDRRIAIDTAPLPLHPAAAQWFRDNRP